MPMPVGLVVSISHVCSLLPSSTWSTATPSTTGRSFPQLSCGTLVLGACAIPAPCNNGLLNILATCAPLGLSATTSQACPYPETKQGLQPQWKKTLEINASV